MTGPGDRRRVAQLCGLGALALGAVLLLTLHVIPPTNAISPVRRTLSEYAMGPNKWLFDLSLLLVAAGSATSFAELALRRGRRLPVVFGAVWTVSLLVLVAFTKTDWSVGPSLGGTIHRYTSVVAFVSLPVAVLLAARAVFPAATGWRRLARGLGVVSLLWFGVILGAVAYMAMGGPPWWRALPLGLVERTIVGTAFAALAVLAAGLLRRQATPPAAPPPSAAEALATAR